LQTDLHLASGMDLHGAKPIDARDLFRKIVKATEIAAAAERAALSPIRSSGVAQ